MRFRFNLSTRYLLCRLKQAPKQVIIIMMKDAKVMIPMCCTQVQALIANIQSARKLFRERKLTQQYYLVRIRDFLAYAQTGALRSRKRLYCIVQVLVSLYVHRIIKTAGRHPIFTSIPKKLCLQNMHDNNYRRQVPRYLRARWLTNTYGFNNDEVRARWMEHTFSFYQEATY